MKNNHHHHQPLTQLLIQHRDPTIDPTSDPTADPTTDPTVNPTKSPLQPPCEYPGELDIVFLVDSVTLENSDENCLIRQQFISEFMTGVKGVDTGNPGTETSVRLAYIEFGTSNSFITYPELDNTDYNVQDFTATERQGFALDIEGKQCRIEDPGTPNLYGAIQAALDEFALKSDSSRDKKIVIFNSGYVSDAEQQRICDEFADKIRTGTLDGTPERGDNQLGQGINVIIANFADDTDGLPLAIPDNYISCLTEFDDGRIFNLPYCTSKLFNNPNNFDSMIYRTCSEPSPSPTTDPTIDPTRDPTSDPTRDPTADPTSDPTADPTRDPSPDPTQDPTADPTIDPTADPTKDPTADPTRDPTSDPTRDPTADPTIDPTRDPTKDPTSDPTRDPTKDPTRDPTRDPTADPTRDPTSDPTADPTRDPTSDPTADPTRDPTTDPTTRPTLSPIYGNCEIGFGMDVIFLVDYSCQMTTDECDNYFEGISEFMGSIKGDGSPRFAYIPFSDETDPTEYTIEITLDDPLFNDLSLDPGIQDQMAANRYNLSQFIANGGQWDGYANSPCVIGGEFSGTGSTNLIDAILVAINHLNNRREDDNADDHHKKVVIFSRCLNDVTSTVGGDLYEEPCDFINKNPRGENKPIMISQNLEVEFVVVNVIGDGSGELITPGQPVPSGDAAADEYLVISQEGDECLIEDDIEGRLVIIGKEDNNQTTLYKFFEEIDEFQTEVCGQPSKAPTSDPTTDPTKEPTTDPTRYPTPSPLQPPCEYSTPTDVVVLVDVSGGLSDEQCSKQMEYIGETVTGIKGPDDLLDGPIPVVRVAVIEYGNQNDIDAFIGLDNSNYNVRDVLSDDIVDMYNDIRARDCGPNSPGNTDLDAGIQAAIDEFNNNYVAGRDRKIIIYSNKVDNQNINQVFRSN